jgi:hypothetical protein
MLPNEGFALERQEKSSLRLLCSNLIQPSTRVELCNLVAPAFFFDGLHRTIFEEIHRMGQVAASELRMELEDRVAGRGFPDFKLAEFLSPEQASEDEIEDLFGNILRMIEIGHRDDEFALEN